MYCIFILEFGYILHWIVVSEYFLISVWYQMYIIRFHKRDNHFFSCDFCWLIQARLNCKHCGKPVIDVRIGMQYFSEYSNVQQCPHCGNLDYHFVKPFSSYKVLEAYWQKLCLSNSHFIGITTLLQIFSRKYSVKTNFFSNLKKKKVAAFFFSFVLCYKNFVNSI